MCVRVWVETPIATWHTFREWGSVRQIRTNVRPGLCADTHVHTHTRTRTHTYTHTHVHTHTRPHTHTYTRTQSRKHKQTNTCAHIHTRTRTNSYTDTDTDTERHAQTHTAQYHEVPPLPPLYLALDFTFSHTYLLLEVLGNGIVDILHEKKEKKRTMC